MKNKESKKIAPVKIQEEQEAPVENKIPAEQSFAGETPLPELQMPKGEEKDEYTIEVVKDFYGRADAGYLSKKDPNYEYRWLRYDHKNLSIKSGNLLHAKGGWQLCPREHLLKIGIKPRQIWSDGLYHVGDTVLARMPKDLYLEKCKYKDEQAALPMKAVRRRIKEGDATVGGKEMHETMRGLETAKQLGMK